MTNQLSSNLIEGSQAFRAAVRNVLTNLPVEGSRQIWLIDQHFHNWPLNEAPVLDALGAWLRTGGRRIGMLGVDFDAVAREHPRLVRWRQDHGHGFDVWQPASTERRELAGLLLTGHQAIELLDREHWRARAVHQASELRLLDEHVVSKLHHCEPGWPVTKLGL